MSVWQKTFEMMETVKNEQQPEEEEKFIQK